MANTVTGFYETLVAELNEASQTLIGTNALLDCVTVDYRSRTGDIGQTLDVVIPASITSSVTDVGSGNGSTTDLNNPYVAIQLDKHAQYAFLVRDFEQVRAGDNILKRQMQGAIGGVAEYIDKQIAALFTSSNFTTNTAISCTSSKVTNTQLLSGRTNLIAAKAPVHMTQDMFLVCNGNVHSGILGDANMTSAQIASNLVAQGVHQAAALPVLYGAQLHYDQQMDSLNTGTAPSRTFTAAYFHRWAVALVSAPLPKPIANSVEYAYVYYKGVPIRVTMGFERGSIGNVVQLDAAFGVKVVRESLGQLFSVAE